MAQSGESRQAIETLFLEERRYQPPGAFAEQANAQPGIYDEELEAFWEREARERVTWFEPWERLLEWELPYAKWFLGGKLNIAYNCVDRHVEAGRGDRVAYHWEGEPEGERRAVTYADLQREVTRLANALKGLGVGKGTPVGIYLGMVPEAPIAMLACARLGAPHTVVFGGFSADSLSDRLHDMECEVLITQDEAWRRGTTVPLKRTADEALGGAVRACERRPPPHRQRGADERGPRPLVARARDRRVRVPARADGRRGPPLPALHVRHDREAEGDRAHDRRLPRRRRVDAPLHLRPQARRRLLVRRRRRLGDRAQLHRLRAALQRRHEGAVRGHARLPGQGPLVGDRRALRRHDPLHGPDRDPRAHEVGPGARTQARPLLAATARLGRRADQPRGLGLVPRAHRRRALPDRGHVVADGDRDDPDHAAAGDHDDEARLGHAAVPRRRRGRGRRGGQRGRRGRRLPRAAAAVARDAARDLQATTATARRTGRASPASTSPATGRGSTRTATSGCSAASTT